MTEQEELASLFEVARTVLRQDVASSLTGDSRFKAAMVANALSIAARWARLGEVMRGRELAAMQTLLDQKTAGLEALRSQLVEAIRAGRFDEDDERQLRACLKERVAARLSISYPDYQG